jgi:hypothetical protein
MVYAWSTGLLGTLLVTPQTGKEALLLENPGFNSGTNITLNLRNTGSAAITLSSYYVKDSNGNQYSRTAWSTGPNPQSGTTSISPNALGTVFVLIGSTCAGSCPLTGTAYTFTTGYSYTIVVVTSRNNQFSFAVVR